MTIEHFTAILSVAGSEYSYTLPAKTIGLVIENPTGDAVRAAFAIGVVTDDAAAWKRISPMQSVDFGEMELTNGTLYLSSPSISGAKVRVSVQVP